MHGRWEGRWPDWPSDTRLRWWAWYLLYQMNQTLSDKIRKKISRDLLHNFLSAHFNHTAIQWATSANNCCSSDDYTDDSSKMWTSLGYNLSLWLMPHLIPDKTTTQYNLYDFILPQFSYQSTQMYWQSVYLSVLHKEQMQLPLIQAEREEQSNALQLLRSSAEWCSVFWIK